MKKIVITVKSSFKKGHDFSSSQKGRKEKRDLDTLGRIRFFNLFQTYKLVSVHKFHSMAIAN